MKVKLFFSLTFLSLFPFYGKGQPIIKIIDTLNLRGIITFEQGPTDVTEFTFFKDNDILDDSIRNYKKWSRLKSRKGMPMLSQEIYKGILFGDSTFILKFDTLNCSNTHQISIGERQVLYESYEHSVDYCKVSIRFYNVLFLDRYAYFVKHKVKYNKYLLPTCPKNYKNLNSKIKN